MCSAPKSGKSSPGTTVYDFLQIFMVANPGSMAISVITYSVTHAYRPTSDNTDDICLMCVHRQANSNTDGNIPVMCWCVLVK